VSTGRASSSFAPRLHHRLHHTRIARGPTEPELQCLRRTDDLVSNRPDLRSPRFMGAVLLLHQAHRPLPDLVENGFAGRLPVPFTSVALPIAQRGEPPQSPGRFTITNRDYLEANKGRSKQRFALSPHPSN